jgi:hypothetical protein
MAEKASVQCDLYASAFPSEAVFAFKTISNEKYEGVAPMHYVQPTQGLSQEPIHGVVRVRLIRNGGKSSLIATPDGEVMEVSSSIVQPVQ